jgi:hypothetical protein
MKYNLGMRVLHKGCKLVNRSHQHPLKWLFFGKYSWNILENKFQLYIFKYLKFSLYHFVKVCVKHLPKKCRFQSFSNPFTSPFTA